MFGQALRLGLSGWARAPIAAALGLAIGAGVVVVAWGAVIEVSPDALTTWGVCALIANLALAGWGRFCSGERRRPGLVLSGFTRPISVTIAGIIMAAVIVAPAWAVHAVLSSVLAPSWLATLAAVLVACAAAPPVMTLSIDAAAGTPLMEALTDGLRRARGGWAARAALCLTAFGLAIAGPLPGLLLEQHGLAAIEVLLPAGIAELDLAIVRLVAALGAFASIPMASCVWMAAGKKLEPKEKAEAG